MARQRTISDEELLAIARKVFREKGHVATTRAIAEAADISEGVLYQRFGTKEDLFFASMAPRAPDVEELLGPNPPEGDAVAFLKGALVRMARYFGEVIPLALHVMTHPSFAHSALARVQPGLSQLHKGLAARLAWFESRKALRHSSAERAAQILISLAHDWVVGGGGHFRSGAQRTRELEEMAETLWQGLAPADAANPPRRR